MSGKPIDADVFTFIRHHVDSVELLEVLLLLHRDKSKAWTAREVTAALRSAPAAIASRLETLARDGLAHMTAASEPAFTFNEGSADQSAIVDRLARAYGTYRLRVIEAIYDPSRRALESFADAFRLGKKGEDNG